MARKQVAAPDPVPPFRIGDHVRVVGAHSVPLLNGRKGVVVSMKHSKHVPGRWFVRVYLADWPGQMLVMADQLEVMVNG